MSQNWTEVTLPPLDKHNSRNVLKLSWLSITENFLLTLAFTFAAVFNHVHFNWFFSCGAGTLPDVDSFATSESNLRFLLSAFALKTSWLDFWEREPARNGGTNLLLVLSISVVTIFENSRNKVGRRVRNCTCLKK